ncbi:hypothetical protein [uncultured Kordia sp.]|uniref:hypothetical protein n=1 Tax=uncultured Kordia sp. TaxID=507699 RepID=UPI0026384BF7|nr:hypothetical protein [uncultured Kordia sp.]
MKKQKLTFVSLQLKKVNIANLNTIKGSADHTTLEPTENSICCTDPLTCHPTLTTRPDSFFDFTDGPRCKETNQAG